MLRPIPGASESSADLPFPMDDNPTDAEPPPVNAEVPEADGVKEVHSVPGENEIGALLDDATKRIQHHQKWALREWIEAAKLLVVMQEHHGYRGERYEQFALAHLPIKTTRDAHSLYLLGFHGDAVLAESEAQEKLVSNYEPPHWRSIVARLRREAQKKEQGDGAGADPEGKDKAEEKETEPDAKSDAADEMDARDARIHELQDELAITKQTFRSERAKLEERIETLSDVSKLLRASEKAMWDTMPASPSPEPPTALEPPPTPEREPEPAWESLTIGGAISMIYAIEGAATCSAVRDILARCDLSCFDSKDFTCLQQRLEGAAQWQGDHYDLACSFVWFEESARVIFATAQGCVVYERGKVCVLSWEDAAERIAPQMERHRREVRNWQFADVTLRTKLPAKRKLKKAKELLNALLAQPGITTTDQAAVEYIRAMTADEPQFGSCRTFRDYMHNASDVAKAKAPA